LQERQWCVPVDITGRFIIVVVVVVVAGSTWATVRPPGFNS
jgi:hypothetical protein